MGFQLSEWIKWFAPMWGFNFVSSSGNWWWTSSILLSTLGWNPASPRLSNLASKNWISQKTPLDRNGLSNNCQKNLIKLLSQTINMCIIYGELFKFSPKLIVQIVQHSVHVKKSVPATYSYLSIEVLSIRCRAYNESVKTSAWYKTLWIDNYSM